MVATTKAVKPTESPDDPDPVSRLIAALDREGFAPMHDEADQFGERIYRRKERVLFSEGETAFVLIDFPQVTEKVLQQAMAGIQHLFSAKKGLDRVMSVFQPTTVYVCIVSQNESPHAAALSRFITHSGGAVLIPVVMVPEINQVVYPSNDTGKIGVVKARIEYLQYLLGERRENVNVHKQTIQTFWVSVGVVGLVVLGAIISAFV